MCKRCGLTYTVCNMCRAADALPAVVFFNPDGLIGFF